MKNQQTFEMGDTVYCIKAIGKFILGRSYYIAGSGDLSFNIESGKKGYGFSLCLHGDYKPLGFFTMEEMPEYFCDTFLPYIRDKKINQLLDLDKYN
jgi:hypothetical protein